MMENIIEELRHLMAEKLDRNIKLEEIDPDAPLLGDGSKLDSLAIVELITLSEAFDAAVPVVEQRRDLWH